MFSSLKKIWNRSWQSKLSIIGAALVAISAVVGITYGVLTSAGDIGLMTLNGKEIKWKTEDLPIGCFFDSTVADKDLEAFDSARVEINKKVGKELIGMCMAWQLDSSLPTQVKGNMVLRVADTEVAENKTLVESPFTAHAGGVTVHNFDVRTGYILSVHVRIDPTLKKEQMLPVYLHELGHVLGLAHDRTRSSIMYPSLQDRPSHLSEKDVKTLKDIYAKK